jgi:hypothetical protein
MNVIGLAPRLTPGSPGLFVVFQQNVFFLFQQTVLNLRPFFGAVILKKLHTP